MYSFAYRDSGYQRKFPSLKFGFIILLLSGALFSNCVKGYHPRTEWEKAAFHGSDLSIMPDDIREKLQAYRNKQVAWAGIIKESEFYDNQRNYEIILLLEHRYFDWNLEVTDSQVVYPSTLGEGFFQTRWYLKKEADLDYFIEKFSPKNLVIVYATPDTVIDDIVIVKSEYIRVFDRIDFDAETFEYFPMK